MQPPAKSWRTGGDLAALSLSRLLNEKLINSKKPTPIYKEETQYLSENTPIQRRMQLGNGQQVQTPQACREQPLPGDSASEAPNGSKEAAYFYSTPSA